jgi:hypothetical protein
MRGLNFVLAVGCAGVLGAAFPTGSAGAAVTNGWSIQPTPNPTGAVVSQLASVSCFAADACTAVGNTSRSGGAPPSPTTLAERWNGTAWTIQPTPAPSGSTVNELLSVSCPARQFCMAVGFKILAAGNPVRGISESWDGRDWTLVPIPMPAKASYTDLTGVSCSSPGACTAVGLVIIGNQQSQPMAESWDGTAWALETVPNPHAENGSSATAVSCSRPSACTAGAEFGFGDVDQSVYALRWDGTDWAQQTQPNPTGQSANYESSVSCPTSSACTAVGSWTNIGSLALAERWNGTKWVRQTVAQPEGSAQSEFGGVTCTGAFSCVAVGTSSTNLNGVPTTTLAEQWHGTGWTAVPTPNPAGAEFATLAGVSCTTTAFCIAIGNSYDPTTKVTSTLAEVHKG